MSETQNQPSVTHEGKQRNNLVTMLYALITIGITTVMAFMDIWPSYAIQEMLADDKGMYPVKLSFLLLLLFVGVILFPVYWITKKMIEKKNEAEVAAMPITSSNAGAGVAGGKTEFSFEYSGAVCTVNMDDVNIQIKYGFVKRNFPASRLRNFYLLSKNSFQTLHLSYEDESGKVKKMPMNANPGDPQMTGLVAELQRRFPNKSLNHLPQAEALKIMKVMSPALMVTIVLGIILAITAVIIYFAVSE